MSTTNQQVGAPTQNVKKTITERRIKSSKGLLVICSIIALLADIGVLAVLLMNVTEMKFWLCPAIILALDVIFFFKAVYSNYRFSYAIGGMIYHLSALVLATVGAWLLTGYLEERIVFETVALLALPAMHLLQCIAVLCTALFALNRGKIFRRVITAVFSVLFVAGVGFYGYLLSTDGFFGQGFSAGTIRTLVYSYNEEGGYYVAEDILEGRGETVVVPEEFNGKPVGGVSCTLLGNHRIHTVELKCATDVAFTNAEKLAAPREDLQLLADKSKIDAFRQSLYKLVETDPDVIHLANSMVPADLAAKEVYMVFRYDADALRIAGENIIPTWVATQGTTFRLENHAGDLDYIQHSDVNNVADLYYCHQKNGYMFRRAVDDKGLSVNGSKVDSSTVANVMFDKIYRVSISEDNDEKFTIREDIRFTETVDGTVEYKLATADKVQDLINALPPRDGFTLTWRMGNSDQAMGGVQAELDTLDNHNKDLLELRPEWKLNDPVINTLTANGVADRHNAVYGSEVHLSAAATAPASGIELRYEWKKGSQVFDVENIKTDHTITNMHPSDAGVYHLTVTAYSDSITSLTSDAENDISLVFVKKDLNISWELPVSQVYSGEDKAIAVRHTVSDVINNDEIQMKLSQNSVKNAGEYNLSVALDGECASLYRIVTGQEKTKLVIDPYPLNITWDELTRNFVYNGKSQLPEASANGIGDDGALEIRVEGAQRNAGIHNAQAKLDNTNYVITNATCDYYIAQMPITVTWDQNTFVYNGRAQGPAVRLIQEDIPDDMMQIISGIEYEGYQTNVGTAEYLVRALLPAEGNYCFNTNVFNSDVTAFTITPKDLSIVIDNQKIVYNGLKYSGFTFTNRGLAETDKIEDVLDLEYMDEAVNAITVRETPYKIDAVALDKGKLGNYEVTIHPGELTIQKRSLWIRLTSATKVYDGLARPYDDFAYTCEGLATTDTIEDVCWLTFVGEAVDAVNVNPYGNKYLIDATIAKKIKYENYAIEIITGELEITPAPLTVTVSSGNKIYDGYTATSDLFDITVDGLVNGETADILGTPNFDGTAFSNKNVGAHSVSVWFYENDKNRNYRISVVEGTYEITKRDLIIYADDASKTYDGTGANNGYFGYTFGDGLVESDRYANWSISFGGTAATARNVGTYELSLVVNSNITANNYSITLYPAIFEIQPRSVEVTVNANTKIYDGKAGGSFTFTVQGKVPSDSNSVFGTPEFCGAGATAVNVGTYALEVLLPENDNYVITAYHAGTLEIRPKSVNVVAVKTTREYDGTANNVFDFEVNGLVEGDTKAIFGAPVYEGSALTAKKAGSYAVKVKSLEYNAAVKNYTLNYVSAVSYTITKKSAKITAIGGTKVYDGMVADVSAFDFEVSGLVGSDTKAMLGTPIFSGTARTEKYVGSHTLKVSLSSNGVTDNYNFTYEEATFIITKRALTVTAKAEDRAYDSTKTGGDFSFEMSGLASTDSEALFGNPTYGGTALTAQKAGTYELTVKFASGQIADNYEITYVSDEFVISGNE